MTSENQFGVSMASINKWKQYLCQTEVEGRRIRNAYRIEWSNSHPLAENFLWTNLANKVCYSIKTIITVARVL